MSFKSDYLYLQTLRTPRYYTIEELCPTELSGMMEVLYISALSNKVTNSHMGLLNI